MELIKKQADEAADISEKKKIIEQAGMKLTDDELDKVSGGGAAEAERYLDELMLKYGCPRQHLYDLMSREECEHYVYLYEN